jgi:hypothetical protein
MAGDARGRAAYAEVPIRSARRSAGDGEASSSETVHPAAPSTTESSIAVPDGGVAMLDRAIADIATATGGNTGLDAGIGMPGMSVTDDHAEGEMPGSIGPRDQTPPRHAGRAKRKTRTSSTQRDGSPREGMARLCRKAAWRSWIAGTLPARVIDAGGCKIPGRMTRCHTAWPIESVPDQGAVAFGVEAVSDMAAQSAIGVMRLQA